MRGTVWWPLYEGHCHCMEYGGHCMGANVRRPSAIYTVHVYGSATTIRF